LECIFMRVNIHSHFHHEYLNLLPNVTKGGLLVIEGTEMEAPLPALSGRSSSGSRHWLDKIMNTVKR
ncbi:hypothetical protein PENTCL1PPCAC_5976, partial [Pristionchus entomophagus]